MRNKIFLFIFLFNGLCAQISLDKIEDLSNLSNNELNEIRKSLSKKPISDSDKLEIEKNKPLSTVKISSSKTNTENNYFGYNYFNRDIVFFDNISTPMDYKLGPGDEITLSIWGETNLREKFIINKDGSIFYDKIGFVNISNKNLDQAESLLLEEFSKIYSTLSNKNNSTYLKVELNNLKSINIFFTGQINNPGVHLIHPFSDILLAITQAGGINKSGSLREISVIRDNKILTVIDLYSFFNAGVNPSFNLKLIDGDVIHIPPVKTRVKIGGEIFRPGFYEVLKDETLSDLISHSLGLTSTASSIITADRIAPVGERESNDFAKSSIKFNYSDSSKIQLKNGDNFFINKIGEVNTKVQVLGRVKNPGLYPAFNTNLKDILDIAGGFDDPYFRKTIRDEIIISRKDENQYYNLEFKVLYENAADFKLEIDDKIFVYENKNFKNDFTYRVEGEVLKPGTFIYKKDITVAKAIELAGGLSQMSSFNNIVLSEEFTSIDENGDRINKLLSVGNVKPEFKISPNSVIKAVPLETTVSVVGNIYNPGLISYKDRLTVSKAITLAGGYKPFSIKKRVYVKRVNGEIKKVSLMKGRFLYLQAGDEIIVPEKPNQEPFDVTRFISDLSVTIANIAAIFLVIENTSNN